MIIKSTDVPRMRFLEDMPCNSVGDIVRVVQETFNERYYYDGCHRYCYVYKNEEGILYEYIPIGQRTNARRKK